MSITLRRLTPWLLLAALCHPAFLPADPIAVRFQEGSVHGFLALRTLEGKVVASGDLTQIIKGSRVVSHLVFHFKDGSVDDETATFSQHGTFRLFTDRHIQKGPTFPDPSDVLINATTGLVRVRYREHDRPKVETVHMDLPLDLANGILLDILKNLSPDAKETRLSYLAATPKPRIVHLAISPDGEASFAVATARHTATRFRIKAELGGLAGIVAPLIGKQPAEMFVWVTNGEVPAFVKSEGPLYLGGPLWRIEMTGPVWSQAESPSR